MSEEALLQAIGLGGRNAEAALRRLYDLLAPAVLGFFRLRGLSEDDADDVLQETFIKIFRHAASYRGDGTARSWLWQIARNCLVDHLRRTRRLADDEVAVNDEQWVAIQETTAEPRDCGPGQSLDDCVAAGLEAFAAQMPSRAAALMLYMDELSMAEIADRLGRSVGATKEYLSQCRKKVQPFIAHCLDLTRGTS